MGARISALKKIDDYSQFCAAAVALRHWRFEPRSNRDLQHYIWSHCSAATAKEPTRLRAGHDWGIWYFCVKHVSPFLRHCEGCERCVRLRTLRFPAPVSSARRALARQIDMVEEMRASC